MKKLLTICALLLCLLMASQVFGFSDTRVFWDGWGNGKDDLNDVIGHPDIIGGQAAISPAGYLTGLTFTVNTIDDRVKAGDLFIDSTGDGKWDYLVNLLVGTTSGGVTTFSEGDKKLYSFKSSISVGDPKHDPGYTLSYDGGGYDSYRQIHPVAYDKSDNLTLINDPAVTFTGWKENGTPTFTFGNTIKLTGETFSIGWGQQCANDALYETMNNPVPEPASMLLLGSGLIGLAGWGRKKFFKKEAVTA